MGEEVTEFIKWAAGKKTEHPELEEQISDYVQLCIDEIDDGGSINGEIESSKIAIEQLIEGEE